MSRILIQGKFTTRNIFTYYKMF